MMESGEYGITWGNSGAALSVYARDKHSMSGNMGDEQLKQLLRRVEEPQGELL